MFICLDIYFIYQMSTWHLKVYLVSIKCILGVYQMSTWCLSNVYLVSIKRLFGVYQMSIWCISNVFFTCEVSLQLMRAVDRHPAHLTLNFATSLILLEGHARGLHLLVRQLRLDLAQMPRAFDMVVQHTQGRKRKAAKVTMT